MHAHPHDRHGRARPAARRCRRRGLPGGLRRDRPPPERGDRLRRRRSRRAARARRSTRAACAIGETGLDDYRDYAPRADQERAFAAQIELARETGKPLVIHTRAAEDDTIATLDRRSAQGLEVILHCFSMPDRLDECLEHGWWISFAGNVTYPKAQRPRRGGRAGPARPPAGRDRRALPDAAGRAQGAQPSRPTSSTPRASSPSAAGSPTRSSRRRSRPTPPAVRLVSELAGAAEPAPHAARSASARTATSARTSSSTRTSST